MTVGAVSQEWISMRHVSSRGRKERERHAPCELRTFSCSEFREGQARQSPANGTRSIPFHPSLQRNSERKILYQARTKNAGTSFATAGKIKEVIWVKQTRKQAQVWAYLTVSAASSNYLSSEAMSNQFGPFDPQFLFTIIYGIFAPGRRTNKLALQPRMP